jgi:hypothetical protein
MMRISLIAVVTLCLTSFAANRPAAVVILADDADYKAATAAETIFEGVLERTPTKGTLGGPARFNPYRLNGRDSTGKPQVRELFVGAKAPLLAVHVGQRVRVAGKLVEVETDGTKQMELWAGRVESLSEAVAEAPGTDGIYARSFWQPASARRPGFRSFVFRDGGHVAKEMNLSGASAGETATTEMARQLRVPSVDWRKHMVVSISAGLRGSDADRLTVTRVEVDGNRMTVWYKLEVGGPGPASGFGYPAETVLVDHCTGPVRVEQEKAPSAPKKAD